MNEELTVHQVRPQGWCKTSTLGILKDIQKARENARKPIDDRPVVTEREFEVLKLGASPEQADWLDRNAVVITPMSKTMTFEVTTDDRDRLYAFMTQEDGKYAKDQKDPAALNRADRRRLRKRKAS